VIGAIDDDLVKAEALDAATEVLQVARGLSQAVERGELVGNHAHRPRLVGMLRKAQGFVRGLILVPGTEGAAFLEGRQALYGAVDD